MADRVELFAVSCPAGTAQANAIETDLSFAPGIVVGVEIIIPSGHAGYTGLAIAQAHSIVIPASGSVWIIGDDDEIKWPLDGYLNSGSWSAFTYNTDVTNGHSWYLRFLVNEIPSVTRVPVPAPLSTGAIMSAGAGG